MCPTLTSPPPKLTNIVKDLVLAQSAEPPAKEAGAAGADRTRDDRADSSAHEKSV